MEKLKISESNLYIFQGKVTVSKEYMTILSDGVWLWFIVDPDIEDLRISLIFVSSLIRFSLIKVNSLIKKFKLNYCYRLSKKLSDPMTDQKFDWSISKTFLNNKKHIVFNY